MPIHVLLAGVIISFIFACWPYFTVWKLACLDRKSIITEDFFCVLLFL